MRYMGYETAYLALGTHYNPSNIQDLCIIPQTRDSSAAYLKVVKSQPPYEPKAVKGNRMKAKLFSRVTAKDSKTQACPVTVPWPCHFPACHVKSQNTKRIQINLTTFKQKALTSFT